MQILEIKNHSEDFVFLVKLTRPQIFSLPQEESQMFSSKESLYAPISPNNPFFETENRGSLKENNLNLPANWSATQYIGLSNFNVPFSADLSFYDVSITNIDTQIKIVLNAQDHIIRMSNGVHKVTIKANEINTLFSTEEDTDMVKIYGKYIFSITPKSFTTNVLNVINRRHYPIEMYDDVLNTNRRNIYEVDTTNFIGTVWNFETFPKQSGRLMGSFVEIVGQDNEIKNHKIIAENDFNEFDGVVKIVLSMDNVGYDSYYHRVDSGDTLRIFPRETYFNAESIVIDYINPQNLSDSAYKFLLNDVVRNIQTGVMEVYDENGAAINTDGTVDGNVIQQYQMQQIGNLELRKKIKING